MHMEAEVAEHRYYSSRLDAPRLQLPLCGGKPHSLAAAGITGAAATTAAGATKHGEWSPYEDNGGTAAVIAGKGYVIVAADTRLNGDFCFHTRTDESKLFQLVPGVFLASTGMQADRLELQQLLKFKVEWYKHNNAGREPSVAALAQLLSTVLYQRRFFPYYTFNILAGIDPVTGDGVSYSYDAVGCTEPLTYGTTGTASSIVEPLLDCLLMRKNMVGQAPAELGVEEALALLRNAFVGAAERDIFTGDSVRFYVIKARGEVATEVLQLRKD